MVHMITIDVATLKIRKVIEFCKTEDWDDKMPTECEQLDLLWDDRYLVFTRTGESRDAALIIKDLERPADGKFIYINAKSFVSLTGGKESYGENSFLPIFDESKPGRFTVAYAFDPESEMIELYAEADEDEIDEAAKAAAEAKSKAARRLLLTEREFDMSEAAHATLE